MPSNFGRYQPYTGFQVTANNTTQDFGQRYTTKDYLLDVYPNIASQLGARTSPGLFIWGNDAYGQLGNGTTVYYSSPIQVGSLTNWKSVSQGSGHSMAVKTDGTLWVWGNNFQGQLGTNDNIKYSSPIQIGSLTNWKQVASSGQALSGALKTDGTLWTWGYNNGIGCLGNNTSTSFSSPVQVGALTNWKQLAIGYLFMSAIKTDGTLWTWGQNTYGQLGNGNVTNYSSPIQVGSLTNWKQVSCGSNYVSAIKTDGTLWTWGLNFQGQLGNGTNSIHYSSPIQVGSLTNWKQVSCGGKHFGAIKTDGTLWVCGYNYNWQLGNGTATHYSSPIQVGSLTNWKTSFCGYNSSVVIKTDGTLWVWGQNNFGQLGIGNTSQIISPIQVGTLTTWKQMACNGSGASITTLGIADGYI